MKAKFVFVIAVLVAIVLGGTNSNNVAAKMHVVGDDAGWTVPQSPATFPSWAAQQNFSVGDTLVFNFVSGAHTVAIVDKEAFEKCDSTNVIALMNKGPALVPLKATGQLHFTCTIGRHCAMGQKLAITVSSSAPDQHDNGSGSPAPAPAPGPALAPGPSSNAPAPTPLSVIVGLVSLASVVIIGHFLG